MRIDVDIDVDIDDILEQLSDDDLLEEVKNRGLSASIEVDDRLEKAVENHRLGKAGSEEALVRLCYDMVGKIV